MCNPGCFDPERHPHAGTLTRDMPLSSGSDEPHHYLWIAPTKDIDTLISTQAARLIDPLDQIFQQAVLLPSGTTLARKSTEGPIRRILGVYTAQSLCQLLVHSLSSPREVNYDKWIWASRWRIRFKGAVFHEAEGARARWSYQVVRDTLDPSPAALLAS